MDTMLVNGTVYPYVDVEPKAYRFRILNAANDRFLNLSLYKANPGDRWQHHDYTRLRLHGRTRR